MFIYFVYDWNFANHENKVQWAIFFIIFYVYRYIIREIKQQATADILYLVCTILGGLWISCSQFIMDFSWIFDLNPFIHTFVNAHIAMYLIWQPNKTVRDCKKNSLPELLSSIVLIYTALGQFSIRKAIMQL